MSSIGGNGTKACIACKILKTSRSSTEERELWSHANICEPWCPVETSSSRNSGMELSLPDGEDIYGFAHLFTKGFKLKLQMETSKEGSGISPSRVKRCHKGNINEEEEEETAIVTLNKMLPPRLVCALVCVCVCERERG